MDLSTEHVTTHTLTLTEAELVELREAAQCALDLGPNDEHAPTWRKLARLGLERLAARGTGPSLTEQYANPDLIGTETKGPHLH